MLDLVSITFLLFPPLLVCASHPAYQARDLVQETCAIDCGGGWCCLLYETCKPSGNGYVCLNSVSGGTSAFDAIPERTLLSSLASANSLSPMTSVAIVTVTTTSGSSAATAKSASSPSSPTASTCVPQSRATAAIRISDLFWGLALLSMLAVWVLL